MLPGLDGIRLTIIGLHNWHAARSRGGCPGPNEMTLLFEVAPPLSRGTTWIELLATGQSAEFRIKLPLHWQRY